MSIRYKDVDIRELNLSVRAYNCLRKNSIENLQNLIEISEEELIKFRNLGTKTLKEIQSIQKKIINGEYFKLVGKVINKKNEISYDCKINKFRDFVLEILNDEIEMSFSREINFISEDRQLFEVIRNKFINLLRNENLILEKTDIFKNYIIGIINESYRGKEFEEILEALPVYLQNYLVIKKQLESLMQEKKIFFEDNKYILYIPNIEAYSSNLEYNKKEIFLGRLKNETLETIGKRLGITKERVRQIEKRIFSNIPQLREDKYLKYIINYSFDRESFCYIFSESELAYNYLKIKTNNIRESKLEINKLLEENLEKEIKDRINEWVLKEYIVDDGIKIKRNRDGVLNYIFEKYCNDEKTIDEINNIYKNFLKKYKLDNLQEFEISERYLEVKISKSERILYKQWKKVRYYGEIATTEDEIIEKMKLYNFKNIEISSQKLFYEYSEYMEELDIRDEYELHNFLKKVIKNPQKIELEFLRMPSLKFGKADRDMQVLNLLIELAPVTIDDLAEEYEIRYGVKKETAKGSNFQCIYEYLYNGEYKIDYKDIPREDVKKLKEVLKDEIYEIEEIKKIYVREFLYADQTLINSYNLKRLGYRVYSNIVLDSKYNNLEEYFFNKIKNKKIINLETDDIKLIKNMSFYNIINNAKKNYQLFEISENKYITPNNLLNDEITLEKIENYIDEVYRFNNDDIFTIKSLRKKGFKHTFEELGFDNYFYATLIGLDNRFRMQKNKGTILLREGKEKVTTGDFVEKIVVQDKSIDIYDLQEKLDEIYGLKIEKYKILENLKEKNLYYNEIMEKAYIDYDTYFEEV